MPNLSKSIPASIPTRNRFFIVTDEQLNVIELSAQLQNITGNTGKQAFYIDRLFAQQTSLFQHLSPDNFSCLKCVYFTFASLKLADGSSIPTYWYVTPVGLPGMDKVSQFIWNGYEMKDRPLFEGLDRDFSANLGPYTIIPHKPNDCNPGLILVTDEYNPIAYKCQSRDDFSGIIPDNENGAREIIYESRKEPDSRKKVRELQILADSATAIFRMDDQLRITHCNKAFETMFRIQLKSVLGKTPASMGLTEPISTRFSDEAAQVFISGCRSTFPFDIQRGKGLHQHFLATLVPEANETKVDSILTICNDISEIKKIEDELKLKEIERKERERRLQESEEKFKALFLNSLDIVFVVDETGTIKYVTPLIENLLGFADHQVIGKSWFDLVHPADSENIKKEFNKILKEPWYNPLVSVRVNNTKHQWIWMEVKGQNKVTDTYINGIILSLRDITERQQAQQALTVYSEMITGILNSITDGFAAIDKNATITLWNQVAEKVIGMKKEDVVGKNLWEQFPILTNSTFKAQLVKALQNKLTVNFEQEITCLDQWFDISMFPYDGGLFIYFKDITAKKKQEMFLAIEKNVLEINSNPSSTVNNTVDVFLEGIEKIHPDIFCSVLLLNESKISFYHLSAPRLPVQFIESLNAIKIRPKTHDCISAMFSRHRVISSDIATDPLWADYRDIAINSNLRACWSVPILNAQEKVIGSLACYYQEVKAPGQEEINLIERTSNLLSVIIENKRAEEKVRISNDLFRLATRASNQAVWNLDLKSEVLQWGEGFYRMFGYKSEYKVNTFKFWITHIHPDEREKVLKGLRSSMKEMNPDLWTDEYRLKKSDGNYALVVNTGYLIYDKNGDPIQMVGSIEDITEKKRLEKNLIKQEIDKQKQIAQAILDTQEKERSIIGKELHDNVNQVLSTARLFLEVAKTKPKERISLINRSSEQIRHAMDEIREISQSLVPHSIVDLGLGDSIKDILENIAITKTLKVSYINVGDIEKDITGTQKLMLYRIIQEQVNNVLKHAEAKHLNIQLTVDLTWIELIISDDGKGFIPEEAKIKKGVGLSNIASRAELFNGKTNIISAPGKGCTVIVKFLRINN